MSEEEILTVSQLTGFVKELLEANFPHVALQGEVSNFRRQSSGHLYFSLKDSDAQVSAVMFRRDAASLTRLPKDGDQVVVRGGLNVYPPRGNYQLIVHQLDAVGLGDLLLQLEQLKKEIHKRGWFAKEHKKKLPSFPKTIGVVTSPTGAALRDMLNVLGRRSAGFHLLLNPVRVQGKEAAGEIAQAIRQFNEQRLADVLIVGRGGGSIEDLWPFNEEIVAKAIFESEIPVVCAVGHETDHCIAEYVADVRAPTPSAAAEIVTAERAHQEKFLTQTQQRLNQTMRHLLNPWMQRLDEATYSLDRAMEGQIARARLLLEGMRRQMGALAPTAQLAYYKERVAGLAGSLDQIAKLRLGRAGERLRWIASSLAAIDPKNLLAKGYSILFSEKERSIIKSKNQLVKDQTVCALLSDGEARLHVE